MKTIWYRGWHWLCARIYFDCITLPHPERLPERGPALYLGLHRNGAGGRFVYRQVAPDCVFLISTQLRQSFFRAPVFSRGSRFAREGRRGRSHNDAALRQCQELLAASAGSLSFRKGPVRSDRDTCLSRAGPRKSRSIICDGPSVADCALGIHYARAGPPQPGEVVAGRADFDRTRPALSPLGD